METPLTPAQAATVVGRHPVTIRKALEGGELHGFQRTRKGRWSIYADCLQAWVEGRPCPHKAALSNVRPIRRGRAAS